MDRKTIIHDPAFGNRAEAFEAFDDIPTNPSRTDTIGDVIAARYGRRDLLKGLLGVSAAAALYGTSSIVAPRAAQAAGGLGLSTVPSGA